jgi:hypothetical protein
MYSTPICFDVCASSSWSLKAVVARFTKILKLQLDNSSRLKYSHNRCVKKSKTSVQCGSYLVAACTMWTVQFWCFLVRW